MFRGPRATVPIGSSQSVESFHLLVQGLFVPEIHSAAHLRVTKEK
jgi:hypothetical protein